nr:transposase, MuDR, MULE transposase domain protein [Tanacetum cinerariifolium]
MNYLRPLVIIDAAYLKGQYKGTNLIAVDMDGNNQIVPIAFGICKGETEVDNDKPLRSCLSARIKNIDGKILGKDGKPLRFGVFNVRFHNDKEVNSLHETVPVSTPLADNNYEWDSAIADGIYHDKNDAQA